MQCLGTWIEMKVCCSARRRGRSASARTRCGAGTAQGSCARGATPRTAGACRAARSSAWRAHPSRHRAGDAPVGAQPLPRRGALGRGRRRDGARGDRGGPVPGDGGGDARRGRGAGARRGVPATAAVKATSVMVERAAGEAASCCRGRRSRPRRGRGRLRRRRRAAAVREPTRLVVSAASSMTEALEAARRSSARTRTPT